MWNFPNCLEAIDGKHIIIQAPARSRSYYFNYKKLFSITLLAVYDAKYRFTFVVIEQSGRMSNGGVFNSSDLGERMKTNTLGIPKARPLPGTQHEFPYVFVADEAFKLESFMIKPYPRSSLNLEKKVCNYRISRARRIIENTFGILAARFRIFRRPILRKPEIVVSITKATVALHNYLLDHENRYCPLGFADTDMIISHRPGDWRNEVQNHEGLVSISKQGSNNYSQSASQVRDKYCKYFNTIGGVVWQWKFVQSTSDAFDI